MHKYNRYFIKSLQVSIALSACLLLSACGQGIASGDPQLGQDKSTMCAQCHGRNGISIVPIYPNLAGQKEQYLILSLKAYRSGERVNMAMTPHARKLSDEDIADLAAYYAQMDPRGGQPLVDQAQ
jgi:cytochrome c553